MSAREELHPRRLPAALWLLGALPAVLFLVAALLYARREPAGAPPAPAGEAEVASVTGWIGGVDAPGGARLYVRLARLHAGELRQAFDRDALARRYELGPGEPWRLVLRLVGDDAGSELELGGLAVADAGGVRLRPIRVDEPPAEDGVADPLAVLLAPPERLHSGEEVSLVLWGPAPASGAIRLVGLAASDAGAARPLLVALEERALAPEPAECALASLEVFAKPAAPPAAAPDAKESAREE